MKWYRYWAARSTSFHVEHAHADGPERRSSTKTAWVDPAPSTPPPSTSEASYPREQGPIPAPAVAVARGTTVVVANQKGGVGKTTTALSVAAALAARGLRILLVDLDPQGNATSGVGLRGVAHDASDATAYDVLVRGMDVDKAVVASPVEGLDVVPSSLDLAGAEIELVSAFSREQKLRRSLEAVRDRYDLVLVDCPPSLGLLTVNALTAGDVVLVPIQCEYYALEGLGSLTQNIELIRGHLNPRLETIGYVMTMHDGRTRLSEQVVDEVRAHFGDRVFTAKVPRSVRLAEAPSFGQPITVFDPGSRGAVAYHRVALELLERLERRTSNEQAERSGLRVGT